MKHFAYSCWILFFALLTCSSVHAQRKIGYINMDDLIAVMPDTKSAQQTIRSYADSLARVDGALQRDFVTRRDAFFQDSGSLDNTKKEAQRQVLQNLIAQESRFQADAKAALDSAQQTMMVSIMSKAEAAVKAAAKASGYTYVFRKAVGDNSRREFVIVGPQGDDLLPLVKKQLGLSGQ